LNSGVLFQEGTCNMVHQTTIWDAVAVECSIAAKTSTVLYGELLVQTIAVRCSDGSELTIQVRFDNDAVLRGEAKPCESIALPS